jgi:hypothetical protein
MKPKIIENFINKEMCNYIDSYMKESGLIDHNGQCLIFVNKEDGENSICMGYTEDIFYLLDFLEKKELQNSLIYDIFNLIGKNMCHVFNFKDSEIIYETMHYKCLNSKEKVFKGMEPHCDQYGEGGKIYTAVLYLNDNFEGGEIIFYNVDQDVKENKKFYKPSTGSIVCFDGHTLHSVNDLISGERSCLVLHLRFKE